MTAKSRLLLLIAALATFSASTAANEPQPLASGFAGTSGSTVGPDGALYITEGIPGQISRVDPWTGEDTVYATGLPVAGDLLEGAGGPVDVAFVDGVAYVLVNLVGRCFDFNLDNGYVGIYRMEGPDDFSLLADLGGFAKANLPPLPPEGSFEWFLPCGVPYAMEPFRGGLLVTDGHLNRVLWVSLSGDIHIVRSFGNIVPTGLEVRGKTIFMAQAGPIPHLPADGRIVAIDAGSGDVAEVASGAPLLVDVEFGLGNSLYGLAQGEWCPEGEEPPPDGDCGGKFDGLPAEPGGGSLVEVNADGSFTTVASGLNLPTSVEFIGNSAYIVNLLGEIWVVDDVSEPPFGKKH